MDDRDLQELKSMARDAGGAARLCLHERAGDALHSMIIVRGRQSYSPPKSHDISAKVYHWIEGELYVLVFAESGHLRDVKTLGARASAVVHIAPGLIHTTHVASETAAYHELVAERFDEANAASRYADFAPPVTEPMAGLEFIRDALKSYAQRNSEHD